MRKLSLVGSSMILATACATFMDPRYRYESNTELTSSPKPHDCKFEVKSTPPQGYEEIGTFVWDQDRVANGNPATNVSDFKKAVQEDVCKAGGDIVVYEKNGLGVFIGGAVFKKKKASVPEATR